MGASTTDFKLRECFSSATVPRTYTNPKPSGSFFSPSHNSLLSISLISKIPPFKKVQFVFHASNSARKDLVEDIIGLGSYGKRGKDAYPESPSEGKIYVGNLPYDFDSEKLGVMFGQAGYVESSEVIYNRQINQSRGFGFVTMRTAQEAENALEMFNQYDINGRPLTVNKATPKGSEPARIPRVYEPSFRVYVGNLPWQVDNAQLEQMFREHGNIIDARIVYDRDNGRSRGFGFVTMSTEAELNNAIAAVNGQNLDGREITVTIAEQKPRV